MSVPFAYVGVIFIWTTTPIAIQWSSQGTSFLFGVTSRMALGLLVVMILALWLRKGLVWNRLARRAHLAAGLGIFGAMSAVYWSSQYIPSGWISVVFGTSPLITGVLAYFLLDENVFKPFKLLGMLLGLAGLAVMFLHSVDAYPQEAIKGLLAVIVSSLIHSSSAIAIKRINAPLSGLQSTTGGLIVAFPLFLLSWLLFDGQIPEHIPPESALAILYLGVVGSVLGFSAYYFILRKLEASRVALITLISPVSALLLGHWLNREPLTLEIFLGTGLIVTGLASFEFGYRLASKTIKFPMMKKL